MEWAANLHPKCLDHNSQLLTFNYVLDFFLGPSLTPTSQFWKTVPTAGPLCSRKLMTSFSWLQTSMKSHSSLVSTSTKCYIKCRPCFWPSVFPLLLMLPKICNNRTDWIWFLFKPLQVKLCLYCVFSLEMSQYMWKCWYRSFVTCTASPRGCQKMPCSDTASSGSCSSHERLLSLTACWKRDHLALGWSVS